MSPDAELTDKLLVGKQITEDLTQAENELVGWFFAQIPELGTIFNYTWRLNWIILQSERTRIESPIELEMNWRVN